ncbi:MAG TPA: GNAT family N-acetyltransferase [Longimicrobium sp.]|jgi:predicted N-acetyltransferase YhbS
MRLISGRHADLIEPMVDIRPYHSADAGAVSRLIRTTMRISNSADYPMERLQPLIDYFSPEKVDALNRERVCFVAEEAGEVVGTGALEGDELVNFFVAPHTQGGGIGSALLRAVEKAACEGGLRRLKVGSSLAGAPFYRRHGYEPTGETLEGTAGAHIAMEKELKPTASAPRA